MVKDISQRQQVKEARQNSEERYRQLLERLPDGIYRSTREGKLLTVNLALVKMLGYESQKELLKVNIIRDLYFCPEERADALKKLEDRKSESVTFRLKKKDGRELWVEEHGRLVFDEQGNPIYYEGVLRDVTKRKLTEQALTESEERFRTIFENATDGILLTDLKYRRFYTGNKRICNMLGYRLKELKNLGVIDIHPAEALPRVIEQFEKQSKKEITLARNIPVKRKDGTVFYADISSSTITLAGKGYTMGIFRDMTEQKQAQEEKERLQAQLIQAQKMESIGTLVGGVAHDFNNLLTVILGNVEFGLQDSKPGDSIHRDLQRVERAATQASNLVSQLLSFSRRQSINPKHLNLNKTIEDFLKMLKRIIGEDVELMTNLSAELSPVWADPVQIQQVLMNLCVNARDAMPQGGKLLLETCNVKVDNIKTINTLPPSKDKSRNYVEIRITDTGVGIDKETQARIFDPFFTTKEVGKGTGLGLSVVYGIVKQHKGHIEVSSENAKGTSFKIYLPAKQTHQSAGHGKKNITDICSGEETILVVEDEEAVRIVTVRILKSFGYSVLTAHNEEEAIKIFETQHKDIDLVILDVVLPNLSGPEVYKRIRSIKPNLSVLFVTGYDIKAQLNELGRLEQKDIRMLQKPYTKETLGKTVRHVLDLHEKEMPHG